MNITAARERFDALAEATDRELCHMYKEELIPNLEAKEDLLTRDEEEELDFMRWFVREKGQA